MSIRCEAEFLACVSGTSSSCVSGRCSASCSEPSSPLSGVRSSCEIDARKSCAGGVEGGWRAGGGWGEGSGGGGLGEGGWMGAREVLLRLARGAQPRSRQLLLLERTRRGHLDADEHDASGHRPVAVNRRGAHLQQHARAALRAQRHVRCVHPLAAEGALEHGGHGHAAVAVAAVVEGLQLPERLADDLLRVGVGVGVGVWGWGWGWGWGRGWGWGWG